MNILTQGKAIPAATPPIASISKSDPNHFPSLLVKELLADITWVPGALTMYINMKNYWIHWHTNKSILVDTKSIRIDFNGIDITCGDISTEKPVALLSSKGNKTGQFFRFDNQSRI